jgi:hypothetical protein
MGSVRCAQLGDSWHCENWLVHGDGEHCDNWLVHGDNGHCDNWLVHGDSGHCDSWLVTLRLPDRWLQDATKLLPQQFRTGNLLSRTCRLLHTAALLSLEHFRPLVRPCICELPLRIPVQFMPLGLHKHLHIQALFYLTTVTSYFTSARSLYKF